MDGPDTTDTVGARRLGLIAVIAGITLVAFKVFAVGIYVCVVAVLPPTLGWPR